MHLGVFKCTDVFFGKFVSPLLDWRMFFLAGWVVDPLIVFMNGRKTALVYGTLD